MTDSELEAARVSVPSLLSATSSWPLLANTLVGGCSGRVPSIFGMVSVHIELEGYAAWRRPQPCLCLKITTD